jgi:hypothetical protein
MKVIAILFILCSLAARAGNFEGLKESILNPHVIIKKDSLNVKIPKGKARINADFYYEVQISPYEYEYRKCNSEEHTYFLLNGKRPSKINKFGSISELVDTNLSYIQFQKDTSAVSLFETVYLEGFSFRNQHDIFLEVYIPLKSSQQMITVDKPVIYAYSEKELPFTLNLESKGELTFTYPILPSDATWKMKTNSKGQLSDEKNKQYPYLFWEAKQNNAIINSTKSNSHEIINGNDLVNYFEKTLTQLGFNAREKADFITYWCPKFVDKERILVQFYIDDACSVIGELNISPKPDNFRRVFVTFSTNFVVVTDYVPQELKIKSIERNGFTVIEWGGSEIRNDEL